MSLAARMRSITERPSLNLAVGLIFLGSGIAETYEILTTDLAGPLVGAHHGAIIFGLFQVIKTVPDMFEGLEYVEKGRGD